MKSGNKKRILVLSAPFGYGHIKAAETICKAYRENYKGWIKHIDFVTYCNKFFSFWLQKSHYFVVDKAPVIYKLAYSIEDKSITPIKKMGEFLNIREYCQLIKKYRPDLIISTNFLPAAVVSRMHSKFKIPNTVVLTDFVSHRMWVYKNNQKFFVAHKGMVEELVNLGVDKSKICVSGIPVDSKFLKKFDQKKLRKKFKLEDKTTILFMVGGADVELLNKLLASLSKSKNEFQVIVITGRNWRVKKEVEEQFYNSGLSGKVLGFVNNVNEYMAASDLMISKAGGLTVTEALTVGLPMVIVKPIPGQEDGNTKFLIDAGAAVWAKKVKDINLVIDDLLKDKDNLKKMARNAQKLAKPDAAKIILEESMKVE